MCLNLGDLNGIKIYCRGCWQCQKRRMLNYVGRGIAEAFTAKQAVSATFTYGRDQRYYATGLHPHAHRIVYDDLRNAVKMLRKYSDGPMRFFAVAELGPSGGRTHWHCLFFWPEGGMPRNIEFDKQCWIHQVQTDEQAEAEGARYMRGKYKTQKAPWPHGFTYYRELHEKSVRYVVKYLTKDIDASLVVSDDMEPGDAEKIMDDLDAELAGERRPRWTVKGLGPKKMGLSCMPPLGSEYLEREAARIAEGGFALRDLRYTVPNCIDPKTDRPMVYWLQDRSAQRYVFAYFRAWRARTGREDWPQTELTEKYAPLFDEFEQAQARRALEEIVQAAEELEREWALRVHDKPGRWWPLLDTRGVYADEVWKPPDCHAYRRAAKGWEPLHLGGFVSPVMRGPRAGIDVTGIGEDRRIAASVIDAFRRHHKWNDDS